MYPNVEFFNELKSIIKNNILDVSIEDIDKMYSSWEKDKDKKEVKTNFVYSENLIHDNQKIPKDTSLKGIDLPTWFGDYSNKKIVVLGIDPLRNENVFERENKSNIYNDVIVGTPYAFHERDSRENWCAGYWALIDGLVKSKNFVYCTDIFKTYYHNNSTKTRSYLDPNFVNNYKHREILFNELELIKPDLIIVFGKIAHKILLEKNCPKIGQSILKTKVSLELKNKFTDVYTVMHLSKGTRGKNFKTFFNSNDIDTSSLNVENRVKCAEKYVEMFNKLRLI